MDGSVIAVLLHAPADCVPSENTAGCTHEPCGRVWGTCVGAAGLPTQCGRKPFWGVSQSLRCDTVRFGKQQQTDRQDCVSKMFNAHLHCRPGRLVLATVCGLGSMMQLGS
jgi:hypothetical protein